MTNYKEIKLRGNRGKTFIVDPIFIREQSTPEHTPIREPMTLSWPDGTHITSASRKSVKQTEKKGR